MKNHIEVFGDEFEIIKTKDKGLKTINNVSWSFSIPQKGSTLIVFNPILNPLDRAYLENMFQTSSSNSLYKNETYLTVTNMETNHIEDVLVYFFGV